MSTYSNYLWSPKADKNMPYLPPYHQLVPNYAKKHRNSVAPFKIQCSAGNSGP